MTTTEQHLSSCISCSLELERSTEAARRIDELVMGQHHLTEQDVHRALAEGIGPHADKFNWDLTGIVWDDPEQQRRWKALSGDDDEQGQSGSWPQDDQLI